MLEQINEMWDSLLAVRPENALKARYYDGKQRVQDLKISLPPSMANLPAVVGWPAMVVDVLEERLDFEGWTDPAFDSLYQSNDLDVVSSMAHTDALIYGTSFLVVGTGDVGAGEPEVTVRSVSPNEMTAVRNPLTGLVESAVHFTDFDGFSPVAATLYGPDSTVWAERSKGDWVVVDQDNHGLGAVPVVQLINKPRSSKAGGRSEITPAIRYYTDSGVRTLLGAEVAREFYAVPQRYMMGAPESFFLDEEGNPRGAWDAMMGKILAIERDENGDVPDIGSFSAYSPSPFFEQLRSLSQMISAEGGVPATYLGFTSDNPASGDGIRMSENRLVKRAERRQGQFSRGWTEVARLAALTSDTLSGNLRGAVESVRPMWRNPATPTQAATADATVKMIQTGVYPAQGDFVLKLLGLNVFDREMLKRDRANDISAVMKRLMEVEVSPEAAALAGPKESAGQVTAEDEAKTLKAKAEAMGILIRAGVKPEAAALKSGIDGVEFMPGGPLTWRQQED